MQKIEAKIGVNTVYSFGKSEFKGKEFFSLIKKTPAYKGQDGQEIVPAKFQNVTVSVSRLVEFASFLERVIREIHTTRIEEGKTNE
jgi:hypothetical protein